MFEFLKDIDGKDLYNKVNSEIKNGINMGKDFIASRKNTEKDRYDVINDKSKKNNLMALATLPKLMNLLVRVKRMDEHDEDVEIINVQLISVIKGFLPIVSDALHYTYEVYNELERYYTMEELLKYAESKGVNQVEFAYNYYNNRVLVEKLLSMLGILKEQGIDFSNESNLALRILEGNKISKAVEEMFDLMSDEAVDAIDSLLHDDRIELDEYQQAALDRYHSEYMEQYVYPFVTKEIPNSYVKSEKMLNRALKLGKTSNKSRKK